MRDLRTSDFYARETEAYTSRSKDSHSSQLPGFIARLPPGGAVLELGCGAGRDSEALIAAGFDVTPTDGTPEMAAAAQRRLGRLVRVLLFEEISEVTAYDGIWANACLLHVPRADLGAVIARICRALRPGGLFYASYKAGAAEERDRFGRFYNRPDPQWLRQVYEPERWSSFEIVEAKGGGYFNEPTDWLHVTAVKT